MTRADRHSRLAWGVLFWNRAAHKTDRRFYPMLLGETWHDGVRLRHPAFEGECRRTLLFQTRQQARTWAAAEQERAHAHTRTWRFRPVKVRETVRPA